MKKILWLAFMAITFISCENAVKGTGTAEIAQDYQVEPFDAVDASGKFKLLLIPNDSSYVSVQTHKELIDNIKIFVQGETLNIEEDKPVDSFESYVVYLYYKKLNEIELGEKCLMESSSTLDFEEISFEINDEAIINQFGINAKECKIVANDKAEVNIHGEATRLDLKGKNYAKLALEQLNVKVLDVDLTDEAEVMANVSKELTGRVLKNSTLQYLGSPQKDVDVKDNGEILNR